MTRGSCQFCMTSKELRFVLAIGEFSLKTAETQASLAKLLLAHIDGLNNIRQLRSRMARLPDSDELRLLGVELDERESAVSAEIASLRQPLRDALAKAESDHSNTYVVEYT